MLTFPTPPPPPPPLPPPSPAIPSGDSHHSSAPSLLIIVAILAFVITASASIHLLLRLIARSRSSSSSSASPPPSPLPLLPALPVSPNQSEPSDRDKLISSLPIFTLSSLQKSQSQSLDCAVCLSNFRPQDELRLLPACRHAFHSQCVDTWLRSTPSCPLCRASIRFHPAADIDPSRSGSFRVEIGSVSRRAPAGDAVSTGHARSYSLGSSFEYLVEDDVEAVLERMRRGAEGKPENGIGAPGSEIAPENGIGAPGSEIAEIAGSARRGWIRDVVDRIASSASSSFNSLRFSGRIGGNQLDLEANSFVEWEEESGFAVFYRWLAGV